MRLTPATKDLLTYRRTRQELISDAMGYVWFTLIVAGFVWFAIDMIQSEIRIQKNAKALSSLVLQIINADRARNGLEPLN